MKVACFHILYTVNLCALRPKDMNVILMSFLRLFAETIIA